MPLSKIFIGLILAFNLSLALADVPLNRIVVVVNNNVITQADLNQEINFIKYNLKKNQTPMPSDADIQSQVLNQLIDREIQLQRAYKTGIRVSEAQVNKAIQAIAKNNHQTTAQLYATVLEGGLSRAQFRKEIRDQLIIHELQQRDVAATITVSPQEVKDYLSSNAGQALDKTEYHLENITIALPDSPTPEDIQAAQARAALLTEQLRKGADFNKLAQSSSSGENALLGGDLGFKRLLELPTIFASTVITLQVNDVSDPIQTANGFHILKLVGTRQSNDAAPLDKKDLENEVQNILFDQKIQEKLIEWVAQLRAAAYIHKINDDVKST